MKRIFVIGESHYNIIFNGNQPIEGYPSGFGFETVVSLGRSGISPSLITEIGNDEIGNIVISFLKQNNVNIDNIYRFYDVNTALSICIDNVNGDKKVTDYTYFPDTRLDIIWPRIDNDDIVLFGSYFSIDTKLRQNIIELITYCSERKSLIIYDPDYDDKYANEAVWFMPSVIENLEFADIVRGNLRDFNNIYKESDIDRIYINHIKFYCKIFICLDGIRGVYLRADSIREYYAFDIEENCNLKSINEAFNAGLIYCLSYYKIEREKLETLDAMTWDRIISFAVSFVKDIDKHHSLYISHEYTDTLNKF